MDNEIKNKIEAVLFASGKGLGVEQIATHIKESVKTVEKGLKALQEQYESQDGSILLGQHNEKWKLTVRGKYLEFVKDLVSETELPSPLLKTLAVIAFKSPVLQADIIHMRGQHAYDHIKELVKQKFITKDEEGRSFLLKITDKFYSYFDVEGDEEIQEVFLKLREQQSKLEELKIVDVEGEGQEGNQQTLGNLEVVGSSREGDHDKIFEEEQPVRKEKTEEEHEEEKLFLDEIERKIDELGKRVQKQELPSRTAQGQEEENESESDEVNDASEEPENDALEDSTENETEPVKKEEKQEDFL